MLRCDVSKLGTILKKGRSSKNSKAVSVELTGGRSVQELACPRGRRLLRRVMASTRMVTFRTFKSIGFVINTSLWGKRGNFPVGQE